MKATTFSHGPFGLFRVKTNRREDDEYQSGIFGNRKEDLELAEGSDINDAN